MIQKIAVDKVGSIPCRLTAWTRPLHIWLMIVGVCSEMFPPIMPQLGTALVAHPAESAQTIDGCSICVEGQPCQFSEMQECPRMRDIPQCPRGFFCPWGTQEPIPCPSGYVCDTTGLHEAPACPAGFYCPRSEVGLYDSRKQCPSGHFCRNNTEFPLKCTWGADCGVGESGPRRSLATGPTVLALMIVLTLATLAYGSFESRKNRDRIRGYKEDLAAAHAEEKNLKAYAQNLRKQRRHTVNVLHAVQPGWQASAASNGNTTMNAMPSDSVNASAPSDARRESATAWPQLEPTGESPVLSAGSETVRLDASLQIHGSMFGHEATRMPSLRRKTLHKLNSFLRVSSAPQNEDHAEHDTFRFQGLTYKTTQISLSFSNVNLKVPVPVSALQRITSGKRWKEVLRNVSGSVCPGKLTAIMGPSGSGKSSLLNVLTGRAQYGEADGAFTINGHADLLSHYTRSVGFVPQDDVMHEELTVLENLYYSAQLRLPSTVPRAHVDAVVRDVIRILDLQHIAHTPIGNVEQRGISGGERKRVNIGLELVADPAMLVLDEPTSGLDSTTSLKVLRALKRYCKIGATVVTVIHQPRSLIFDMFDDIILLKQGGQVVYSGPAQLCVHYFQELQYTIPAWENPADWIIDVVSDNCRCGWDSHLPCPDDLVRIWAESGPHAVERLRYAAMGAEEREEGLNEQELRELEQVFRSCDVDQSQELNKAQLAQVIVQHLKAECIAHWFEGVFSRHAGSGGLGLEQFLAAMKEILYGDVLDHGVQADSREYPSDPNSSRMAQAALSRARPHVLSVFRRCLGRDIRQKWRRAGLLLRDIVLVCTGAVLLGLLSGKGNSAEERLNSVVQSHTAIALLANIFALRAFGTEREVLWREAASGLSVSAYFVAKLSGQVLQNLLLTTFFALMYHQMVAPLADVGSHLVVFLALTYAMTPFGIMFSIALQPVTSMTAAVLYPMVAVTALSGLTPSFNEISAPLLALAGLFAPGRWSVEANTIMEWKREEDSSAVAKLRVEAMILNRSFSRDADWNNLGLRSGSGSAGVDSSTFWSGQDPLLAIAIRRMRSGRQRCSRSRAEGRGRKR